MTKRISPVISALRTAHDEVQLGRVLSAVVGSNTSAPAAFLDLLLGEAAKDPEIGTRARNLKPPPRVACSTERGLLRHGRGRVRKQAQSLGRVDLLFSADGFRLICELKLDSPYQPDQIIRYLEAEDTWVMSIVRQTGRLQGKAGQIAQANSRWLGEICWTSIQEGLRQIPLTGTTRSEWLAFLDVMDDDGDFLPERRRRARDDDVALADKVAKRSLASVAEKTALRAPVRNLLRSLSVTSKAGRHRAVASIRGPAGDGSRREAWFFQVLLRDSHTGIPHVAVEWIPWTPMRRGQRSMHKELEGRGFFRRATQNGAYYMIESDVRIESGRDPVTEVSRWVERQLYAVAIVGLLDYDAKQLLKSARE